MNAPSDPSAQAASELRKLPRTDELLEAARQAGLVERLGHGWVVEGIREALERLRREVLAGAPCPDRAEIARSVLERLGEAGRGSLRPVVNATGVVLHTNLGRAPLSSDAVQAMVRTASGYSNLEYDLEAGARGDRYGHAEAALCRLTGAEAAVVVNNNAAAVLLALAALSQDGPSDLAGGPGEARPPSPPLAPGQPHPAAPALADLAGGPGEARSPRRLLLGLRPRPVGGRSPPPPPLAIGWRPEVIVSRGQLVEIGGGFRIPEVLGRSGAALVEVGTTNRTYLADYERAIGERTRILLAVHRSNFRLSGFVHDVGLAELVALARSRGLFVVDDLGSGTLLDTARFGLGTEPTVPERIRAGADLVTFSGDKLLGGPQAGILAGRRDAVARLKRHPLLRALRVDKITLAGLSATLAHYERGEALEKIPVWRAIAQPEQSLRARAEGWRAAAGEAGARCQVVEGRSAVGGGSLPEVTLPTALLALPPGDADARLARMRRCDPPVVARIEEDRVVLDPRTVLEGEDGPVLAAVRAALAG